jgi:hypothetical protein
LRLHRETELAGLLIDSMVERQRGRFLAAEQKLRAALAAATHPFGNTSNGDVQTFHHLLYLADHLGTSRETADALVREYALADPPNLHTAESFYEPAIALACARATPEVADAGLRALERVGEQHTSGRNRVPGIDALTAGARAHAHGDMAGAVAAWRPLVRTGLASVLPAGAFDRGGAPELGRHLDRERLQSRAYGGANPANAREAARCAAEGDHECARRHATQVIEAWSTADAEIPAVAEMRALLERLPAADAP